MTRPSIRQLEKLTAFAGSVTILVLLVVRAQHAGGLWRDECAALQLARMASFAEIARNFQHEAFPLLFPAVIRTFTDLFGTSDAVLRSFGLIVGIGIVAAAWFSARFVVKDLPILFLTLVGLNPTILVWATSVRGYGLGTVFIILAFSLIAKIRAELTWPRIVFATLASLAAVHCLLHNVPLLLAINGSAGTVCLFRREFKRAGVIFGIGAICAVSLLPYVSSYGKATSWNIVVKSSVSLSEAWQQFLLVLGSPTPLMTAVWLIVAATLIAVALWRFRMNREVIPRSGRDNLIFLAGVVFVSPVATYAFFDVLSYVPKPWYYVAIISVFGISLDFLAATLVETGWLRICRLILALIALVILPGKAWPIIAQRQTNIDLAARTIEQSSNPNDLIVVSPWQLGIPFSWYYHGRTPWLTLPEISDHRIHRYDLFKEKMMSSRPVASLFGLIRETLRAGHGVWFVGGLTFPPEGQPPMSLAPAPNSVFRWDNVAYKVAWKQQMGALVRTHAERGDVIALPINDTIDLLESIEIVRVQGWKD